MYTAQALLDMHARGQRSLLGLIAHLRTLDVRLLAHEVAGFAFPTILVQLAHVVSAEAYWLDVLQGRLPTTDQEPPLEDVEALEALRAPIAASTAAYLGRTSDVELNRPRALILWGGVERTLMPAHVIVRVVTHHYDHKGQVAAMCRLLGHPIPRGLDFPLT